MTAYYIQYRMLSRRNCHKRFRPAKRPTRIL